MIFDGNVRKKHRTHLLNAIIETSLIKESIFLFSKNCLLELNDIEKDCIWITHIESRDKKSIFRILIKIFLIKLFVINAMSIESFLRGPAAIRLNIMFGFACIYNHYNTFAKLARTIFCFDISKFDPDVVVFT